MASLHPKQKARFNIYIPTLSKSIPDYFNKITNSTGIYGYLKHVIIALPTD